MTVYNLLLLSFLYLAAACGGTSLVPEIGSPMPAEGEDSKDKKNIRGTYKGPNENQEQNENENENENENDSISNQDLSKCFTTTDSFYKEKGPFEVAEKEASGKTFFYPKNTKKGCKYPALGWGNGMAMYGSKPYSAFNQHLASWGIYVCAHHGAGAASGREASSCLTAIVEDSDLNKAIGKKRLTAGHSMGGGGAVNGADREDVVALISMQTCATASGAGLTKAGLYLTGTSDWANCSRQTKGTYERHTGKGFLAVYTGAGHTNTPMGRGPGVEEYRGISVAWALCHTAGISSACKLFTGGQSANIGNQGEWAELKSKNID